MKVINADVLRFGDIILTTSNAKLSEAIKRVTKSDISHAMLYVSAGSVMDATSDGVQARNIEKLFYPDDCAIYVLRLRTPICAEMLAKVVSYVRSEAVMPYSVREAALCVAPRPKNAKGGRKQFCSRLVARAYESVGINLHASPDFCTPEDLKQSSLLVLVDKPSRPISNKEIEEIKRHGDTTKGMVEVSNTLVTLAQKVCPEVVGVEDITRLSILRPELDEGFAQAYQNSGYLTYWQTEEDRFPWRYDLEEMFSLQSQLESKDGLAKILEYCRDTLEQDGQGAFQHWYANAETATQMAMLYPRKTTSLIAQLYFNLVSLHQRRMSVIAVWLEHVGIGIDAN